MRSKRKHLSRTKCSQLLPETFSGPVAITKVHEFLNQPCTGFSTVFENETKAFQHFSRSSCKFYSQVLAERKRLRKQQYDRDLNSLKSPIRMPKQSIKEMTRSKNKAYYEKNRAKLCLRRKRHYVSHLVLKKKEFYANVLRYKLKSDYQNRLKESLSQKYKESLSESLKQKYRAELREDLKKKYTDRLQTSMEERYKVSLKQPSKLKYQEKLREPLRLHYLMYRQESLTKQYQEVRKLFLKDKYRR